MLPDDRVIEPGSPDDIDAVTALYRRCVAHMRAAGNDQWHDGYPVRIHVERDVAAGTLHVLREAGAVVAAVACDERQDAEYATLPFTPAARVLVVHRLAVDPTAQGRGLARAMMTYVEALAQRRGYHAIRFDTYSLNPRALRLYDGLGYRRVDGCLRFPQRGDVFYCYEKLLPAAAD